MVFYVVHNHRTMSLEDYIDFLHSTRWKAHQGKKRMELVRNYLEVLYEVPTATPEENQHGREPTRMKHEEDTGSH